MWLIDFFSWLKYKLDPMRLTRNMTFIAWLVLDFKHVFQFVGSMTDPAAVSQMSTVILFGQWLPGISNGMFDAFAYACFVSAFIYFMSNTIVKRMVRHQSTWAFWVAMFIDVCLSALSGGSVLFSGATHSLFIGREWAGPVSFALGSILTFGLLMFASMESVDLAVRIEKGRRTREHNKQLRIQDERRAKYTPHKYRGKQSALVTLEGGKETRGAKKAGSGTDAA